jgi:hypothetical protein
MHTQVVQYLVQFIIQRSLIFLKKNTYIFTVLLLSYCNQPPEEDSQVLAYSIYSRWPKGIVHYDYDRTSGNSELCTCAEL